LSKATSICSGATAPASPHERLAGRRAHAERRRDRARQRGGVGDAGQLDPAHAVLPGFALRVQERLCQPGLAHATGTHQRDQAVCVDQRRERGQVAAAPDQRLRALGQVGAQRGRLGVQVRVVGGRQRCADRRHDGRGRRLGARGEAVAAAGDRGDQVAAQHLAQRADLRREVVLLDDHAGPDLVHQLVLGQQLRGAIGEHQQQVERAGAEVGRHAVDQQATFVRLQLEPAGGAESQRADGGTHGRTALRRCGMRAA
jgi:hypothetical protein